MNCTESELPPLAGLEVDRVGWSGNLTYTTLVRHQCSQQWHAFRTQDQHRRFYTYWDVYCRYDKRWTSNSIRDPCECESNSRPPACPSTETSS